jgi:hypothetical protein
MLTPDLVDPRFESLLKSLKYSRKRKLKILPISRITELSMPKQRLHEDFEIALGPGSYNPKDRYLSTKSNTPSIKIGKSIRFDPSHTPFLKIQKSQRTSKKFSEISSLSKSLNINEAILSPGFTFKRTGHNLRLVENPSFPGVGRYSPEKEILRKGFSFKKSKRDFNWRRNWVQLKSIADFENRYWNK